MKQREQYQACLDYAEPWLRTGTCPPAGYCVLAPADNNNPRNEAKKHQILTTPPASGTAAEGKSGLPAAEMHVLESGGRKAVNHGFQGKMEGKNGEISVYYRNFTSLKAKTPDFFCTEYGTFSLKIRHFQSKKSVLFRLPCQNLYPIRRS